MKKKIILRGLFGIPTGISIGYLITIFISLGWSDGNYHSCVPGLVEQLGSEVNAVIFQTMLCALLGAVCAALSVIWEIDRWSIAKQTGIYFCIFSLTMLPIAYFARWMEHSLEGFLKYFGIFLAVFIIMWGIQYCIWKRKVKSVNSKVKNK